MIMMGVEQYIKMHMKDSLPELINERRIITKYIDDLEILLFEDGNNVNKDDYPRPDVMYQVYLDYLSVLTRLICFKYNHDVIHHFSYTDEELENELYRKKWG